MPFNRFPLVLFIVALADYLFKAAVNYRLTEEGAAEWSDVEASLADVLGDEDKAESERAQAASERANVRTRQTSKAARPVSSVDTVARRPLSEE